MKSNLPLKGDIQMNTTDIDDKLKELMDADEYDCITVQEFINLLGLEVEANWISQRLDGLMTDMPNHWLVKLTNKCTKRSMTFYYSGGSAVTRAEPDSVVNSIILDLDSYNNFDSAEEMAIEYGDAWAFEHRYESASAREVSQNYNRIWKVMEKEDADARRVFTETQYQFILSGLIEPM